MELLTLEQAIERNRRMREADAVKEEIIEAAREALIAFDAESVPQMLRAKRRLAEVLNRFDKLNEIPQPHTIRKPS